MSKSSEFPTNLKLADFTTYQVGIIQANAYRTIKQAVGGYLQPYNISMMEWFALGAIQDAGQSGIRLTELAKSLQTTMPYTTTLLNALEVKLWIERIDSPDDNRVKLVRLVAGAEKTCHEIEHSLRANMRDHIYSRISTEDFLAYIRTLYALSQP